MNIEKATAILNDEDLSYHWLINCLAENQEEYQILFKLKQLIKTEITEEFEKHFQSAKFFVNQK